MTSISRRTALVLSYFAALGHALPLRAQSQRVATNASGVAIDGYDTRAYWRAKGPETGREEHQVIWQGVAWWFVSGEDAAAFEAAPEAFAPQYGGFCTQAMSFGKVVNGDPEVWRIHAGKLYLFARPVGGRKFDEGAEKMIAEAQKQWDRLW